MLNHRLAIVTAFVLLGPPAPAAQDEAAAKKGSGHPIELSGTVHGKFTATRSNPDVGVAYELTGSGQVPPLGECQASGRFTTLGFVITGRSTGQLTLRAPQGGVTLSLTGPEQRGFSPPPDRFDYQITGGTGSFGRASGSGSVGLTLRQSAGAEANPAAGLKAQTGEFTLNFGHAVALQTAYLSQPIEHFHRLSLDGELGGKGTLSLDPNGCSVTEFGDAGICTRIAVTARDVTLRQEQTPDPTGAGRRLYQIEGAGLGAPLRLVTPPASGGGAYRLVYGAGGAGPPVVVVTLESTASGR